MAASVTVFCLILILSCSQDIEGGTVSFQGFDKSSNLGENVDERRLLTSFDAECHYSWQEPGCDDNNCSRNNVTNCDSCSIPSSGLFELSGDPGNYSLYKKQCSDVSCGNHPNSTTCVTDNGCASVSTSPQSVTVTCVGNNDNDSANDSRTHTVTFIGESPILNITNLDESANASNKENVGDVIFRPTTTPNLEIRYYEEASSVQHSYELGTIRLFMLNNTDGTVYIASDPSDEYSYTYTMEICVYSRRQKACGNLTINFYGCFQKPTCENQGPIYLADTIDIGYTLFRMNVSKPSGHFASISRDWQNLNFTIISTDLTVAVIHVDQETGDTHIITTGNITVFPSYPDKSYSITVRVGNAASCSYTSQCTMNMTVNFTNWDIELVNLDSDVSVHEDTDDRFRLFNITTFDLNNPNEDNVTCVITSNEDPVMFEITQETNISAYEYNSWHIYKNECQDRGCGPVCGSNLSCLNHDIDRQYIIVVECSDAYGSTATGTLTVSIEENEPPRWTNLPSILTYLINECQDSGCGPVCGSNLSCLNHDIDLTITVNTDYVAHMDVIYTFYYTDAEKESLDYNYTYTDTSSTNISTLFAFNPKGNFDDNPANVTALVHQWDLGNDTYTIYVCGTERRNTVCGNLTIQQRDFCGPSPNCTDQSVTTTDQTAPGTTLFSIEVPAPSTGSFSSLSYSIASSDISLFNVNSSGYVTALSTLPVKSPPNPTSYSITAYVYDTAACQIGVCHLDLTVTFTNFNISIDNMDDVSINLHEDTLVQKTLLTIDTSDANTVDGVTCVIDEANSIPANNGKFVTEETISGGNVYVILNKEDPQFDYDADPVYVVAVTCNDLYGSSASANMTVTIDENEVPVLSNLSPGTNITVDLATVFSGDSVFTLTATDTENDALTYFCNVTDTLVPLECATAGVVSLRRNVSISENGTTYQVLMCVEETGHNHVVCETLSVLFTSSKAEPQISNLPTTVTFNETTSVGSTLFTVNVSDPDSGDVHTFMLDDIQPVGSRSMFSFSTSTGVLTLVSSFDYETQTTYTLTFSVADRYLSSVAFRMLYIQVGDVNEEPVLALYTTLLSTSEGSAGKAVGTVIYSCSDIDAGQTPTVSLSSGPYVSYFSMDSATGSLTLAMDWDFESNSLPEIITLGITCSDGAGLSDSGTFTVAISPLNEFAPILNITEVELTIYTNQTLQDSLFSVGANDSDYNDNGQFQYAIAGNGIGKQYFTMSNQGQLFLSNYLSWNYNYTFRFTVEVSDGEPSPLTASVNVIIMYIAPEAAVPTGKSKCLLCTTEGVLVISVISIGGFLVLVFLLHACIRTRAWTLCQSEPIRQHEEQIKKSQRRKQKEDFLEMLREDEDPGHDSEYQPDEDRLRKAIPARRPPGKVTYFGSRDIPPIPGRVEYNPPTLELSTIPEIVRYPQPKPVTNQNSESRYTKHFTKKDWNNPADASHPSQDHLYYGSALPKRLFPPTIAYADGRPYADISKSGPRDIIGRTPQKRKLYK